MTGNCGTCRAYKPVAHDPRQGECIFGPPTAMVIGMAAPQMPKGVMLQGMGQLPPQPVFGGVWPPVRAELGCMCWQPREDAPDVQAAIAEAATAFREPREMVKVCGHPNVFKSGLTGRVICGDCEMVVNVPEPEGPAND